MRPLSSGSSPVRAEATFHLEIYCRSRHLEVFATALKHMRRAFARALRTMRFLTRCTPHTISLRNCRSGVVPHDPTTVTVAVLEASCRVTARGHGHVRHCFRAKRSLRSSALLNHCTSRARVRGHERTGSRMRLNETACSTGASRVAARARPRRACSVPLRAQKSEDARVVVAASTSRSYLPVSDENFDSPFSSCFLSFHHRCRRARWRSSAQDLRQISLGAARLGARSCARVARASAYSVPAFMTSLAATSTRAMATATSRPVLRGVVFDM